MHSRDDSRRLTGVKARMPKGVSIRQVIEGALLGAKISLEVNVACTLECWGT